MNTPNEEQGFLDLPIELIKLILEAMTWPTRKRDYCRLALTCRALRVATEEFLYGSFMWEVSGSGAQSLQKFKTAFDSRPQRYGYVRSMTIHNGFHPLGDHPQNPALFSPLRFFHILNTDGTFYDLRHGGAAGGDIICEPTCWAVSLPTNICWNFDLWDYHNLPYGLTSRGHTSITGYACMPTSFLQPFTALTSLHIHGPCGVRSMVGLDISPLVRIYDEVLLLPTLRNLWIEGLYQAGPAMRGRACPPKASPISELKLLEQLSSSYCAGAGQRSETLLGSFANLKTFIAVYNGRCSALSIASLIAGLRMGLNSQKQSLEELHIAFATDIEARCTHELGRPQYLEPQSPLPPLYGFSNLKHVSLPDRFLVGIIDGVPARPRPPRHMLQPPRVTAQYLSKILPKSLETFRHLWPEHPLSVFTGSYTNLTNLQLWDCVWNEAVAATYFPNLRLVDATAYSGGGKERDSRFCNSLCTIYTIWPKPADPGESC